MRWASAVPLVLLPAARLLTAQPVTKLNPRDGLVYVWIAPGSFMMGCSFGDKECFDWEDKPHPVTVGKGFWIGQTEVTQEAYKLVTGTNPSLYKGANLPVDQIGWDDARKYCEAVSMRLPSEQEWEYAARGGSAAPRYGEIVAIAWYDSNSGDQTHEVGRKQPNAYGLFDMIGNMWEWVNASYGSDKKILRGGSFFNLPRDLRVSNRLWATPDTRHRNMGIRCAGD
jgi:formylglycine-generating enzyme required for sulfatase activity